jgi:hypothetical protein
MEHKGNPIWKLALGYGLFLIFCALDLLGININPGTRQVLDFGKLDD